MRLWTDLRLTHRFTHAELEHCCQLIILYPAPSPPKQCFLSWVKTEIGVCTCWQIAALSQPSQQICDRVEGAQNTWLIKFVIKLISTRWKDEHWSNKHSIFICLKAIYTKTYLLHFFLCRGGTSILIYTACVRDLSELLCSICMSEYKRHNNRKL